MDAYIKAHRARFWSKVSIGASDECWLWTAGHLPKPNDYGLIHWRQKRRMARAHRVSWELAHGDIPPGLLVCHKCDVPRCVNARHLFLGTVSDNAKDAVAKRRLWQQKDPARCGKKFRQFTPDQVRQIRSRRQAGERLVDIAKSLNCKTGVLGNICTGISYQDVL